jgi:hypothetical protein
MISWIFSFLRDPAARVERVELKGTISDPRPKSDRRPISKHAIREWANSGFSRYQWESSCNHNLNLVRRTAIISHEESRERPESVGDARFPRRNRN